MNGEWSTYQLINGQLVNGQLINVGKVTHSQAQTQSCCFFPLGLPTHLHLSHLFCSHRTKGHCLWIVWHTHAIALKAECRVMQTLAVKGVTMSSAWFWADTKSCWNICLFVSAPECRDIETVLYDRTSVHTYVRTSLANCVQYFSTS